MISGGLLYLEVMTKQDIAKQLRPYLNIDEYRQGHINELLDICAKVLDNEIGDYSFRRLWMHNISVFKSSSQHILTQDEWRTHINGLILTLENSR